MKTNTITSDREKTSFKFGNRLSLLRKERGLTQVDFGQQFAEFCGMTEPFLCPTISAWEQNRRLPSTKTIVHMALFFGVSCDYLFGITDKRNETGSKEKQDSLNAIMKSDIPILPREYPNYNGIPVYVTFENNQHINQWGIMDYNNNRVVCKDFTVDLTVYVKCYAYAVVSPIKTPIVSIPKLLQHEYIWIEMKSADREVCAIYNGRYTHNRDKSCLIRVDNGLPLSYNGLDVYYLAFKG